MSEYTDKPLQGAQRINVIGTSGSGKSTFATALAEALQFPYLEMDALFWLPNWTTKTDEAFKETLARELDAPTWVLHGNYSRTQPIKWTRADTVIWLDMPRWTTHYRVTKRSITRAVSGAELWSGNRESLRKSFFSKDSVILWSITSYRRVKAAYANIETNPPAQYQPLTFIHLRSPGEARAFLAQVK
ncbi:MAG: adenylate kinase [Pseudomonadota bacterium]